MQLSQDEWQTLIPGACPGYVSWEDYQQNLKRLHESAQAMGQDRRKSPAREGPALLQGLILCGRCGQRMTVNEMAVLLGITPQWVKIWNRHGLLRGHTCNDKNHCLYEHPGDNPPRKSQGVKLSQRRLASEVVSQRTQEVQCEA